MLITKQEHFGTIERILEWKTEHGYDQKTIAALFDVNEKTVKRWIDGTPIRRSNLVRIAEVMKCDIEYLECTQNVPRKADPKTITLSTFTLAEKYLWKLSDLLRGTSHSFDIAIEFEETGGNVAADSFIDGDTRYYYEYYRPDYDGETYYKIRIHGGSWKRKTSAEIETFVADILKFIRYSIDQL